ncbi:MAG: SRPBCC family protein [Solirubrobacteraceae bacterium]
MSAVARVAIDHDFSLPPSRVFAYLAEHENLEPLFGAKIKRLRDGTDGERNGVGSVRQLQLGPLPAFEETVLEVVPEKLIRYRITKGSPLRDHEGVMRFSSNGSGTHLHYEISFGAIVPGLDVLIAAGLKRSISKGLNGVDSAA